MHNKKKQYNLLHFCKQFEVHVLQYIKYRMYFENTVDCSRMMYMSSPAMNGLNIHVHVLSCAGPPRTVQNLRQVKICRQLTKRAYHVS